jgi:hypothetical protein
MQVAMELLCDRAEKGMPREISFLDEMQLEGIKNPAKNAFDLRGHPKAANEGHLKTGQRK